MTEKGLLTHYFSGIASKKLKPVEADPDVSNQHELNGVNALRQILGDEDRKFDAQFVYLDDQEEPLRSSGTVTWYDSRRNVPTRSAEYRLYYPSNDVTDQARVGDLTIVASCTDGTLVWIVASSGSSTEAQLIWLFGIEEVDESFKIRSDFVDRSAAGFVANQILEELGLEITVAGDGLLDALIGKFGESFPTTKEFSEFARNNLNPDVVFGDPDHALSLYLDHEEKLFRTFERMIVEKRIKTGFASVEDFVSYSLSVQNRRKSRAGHSLENQLEAIFEANKVRFSRGKITENRSKPDFIFPAIESYHNAAFPVDRLTMLASKSTCKDRWRQILAEADRIRLKHLITIEPTISTNQTDEMKVQNVQLIVPAALFPTFQENQRRWLMNLGSFIEFVREKDLN